MKTTAMLALLLLGAAPPEAVPSPFFIDLANVERLNCGTGLGSGVRIDADLVLTADHVVAGRTCSIDGQPVTVVHEDGALDLAVVRTASPADTQQALSCAGFQRGRTYYAIGYAFGERLIVQRLTATGKLTRNQEFLNEAHLRGRVFPGMSGGMIVDEDGQQVGIVNAGNPSGLALSRPLDQTFLCD